jgi:hypothetical protein
MKIDSAPFPQHPRAGFAVCTLAATISTAPTNVLLLGTIGQDDGILTRLEAIPLGSNTAMNLMLFAEFVGKPEKVLIAVKSAPATTVSASATTWVPFKFDMSELNTRRLPKGTNLYVGTTAALAAGMVFTGEWSDF